MENLKRSMFCNILLMITSISYCQSLHPFNITLDTSNYSFAAPVLSLLDPLSDKVSDRMEFNFSKSVPFRASINLSKPIFLQVVNVPILATPKKNMKGVTRENGNELVLFDSADINSLLIQMTDTCDLIFQNFDGKTTFEEYKILYDTLKNFISKWKTTINSNETFERYKLTKESQRAVIEFCNIIFHQHTIYPLLFNSEYQKKSEFLIGKNVEINFPDYWLQLQAGRTFLRTYFFKILLPKHRNDINKVFEREQLYISSNIKRHLGYHYFLSQLHNDTSYRDYRRIVENIEQFERKYCDVADDLNKFEAIKKQLLIKGNDITQLFNQQELVKYSNEQLNGEKLELLKNQGKIIVYYWASWCVPCLETMNNLKKTITDYKGEQYKILFISIDQKHESWKNIKLGLLNDLNSYRLNNFSKPSFYTVFQITQIPRLFLIDNGKLVETNFSKDKFDNIFNQKN